MITSRKYKIHFFPVLFKIKKSNGLPLKNWKVNGKIIDNVIQNFYNHSMVSTMCKHRDKIHFKVFYLLNLSKHFISTYSRITIKEEITRKYKLVLLSEVFFIHIQLSG